MKSILVSGFGGQGVVSLGQLIAYSAMLEGRNVSCIPSYGPEMRGGTASCGIIYDEQEIASPVIAHPDFLIAMNGPSLNKFYSSVPPQGKILINSSAVEPSEELSGDNVIYVPLSEMAEQAGNRRAINLVMLGALIGITHDISIKNAAKAIKHGFKDKPEFIESNLKALSAGYKLFNPSFKPSFS